MENVVYELSYNDICNLPTECREEALKIFDLYTKNIPSSIYRPNRRLCDMLSLVELEKEKSMSEYVFSGEMVDYYPNIKRVVSKVSYTCPVSGMICVPGTESIIFKPFFYIPNKKESYVLNKGIKVHWYYEDFFPRTMKEYDDFLYKVENSYELGLEEYYNFHCNVGHSLNLRKLK